jgi:hypothetical protein
MAALNYWPNGEAPKTYWEEFLRVQVSGIGSDEEEDGLPNRMYTINSHRGCIKLDHPWGADFLTFLVMVAPASIQVGSQGTWPKAATG